MKPTDDMVARFETCFAVAKGPLSSLHAALQNYEIAFALDPHECTAVDACELGMADPFEQRHCAQAARRAQRTLVLKCDPAEPQPDAPTDLAALPDYWDERRKKQGKPDLSRCAAELRAALYVLRVTDADLELFEAAWSEEEKRQERALEDVRSVERRCERASLVAVIQNKLGIHDAGQLAKLSEVNSAAKSGAWSVTTEDIDRVCRAAEVHPKSEGVRDDVREALQEMLDVHCCQKQKRLKARIADLEAERNEWRASHHDMMTVPLTGEWTEADYEAAVEAVVELSDPDGEGPSIGECARAALDAVRYRLQPTASVTDPHCYRDGWTEGRRVAIEAAELELEGKVLLDPLSAEEEAHLAGIDKLHEQQPTRSTNPLYTMLRKRFPKPSPDPETVDDVLAAMRNAADECQREDVLMSTETFVGYTRRIEAARAREQNGGKRG